MSNNNLVLASSLAGAGAGVIEAIVMQVSIKLQSQLFRQSV